MVICFYCKKYLLRYQQRLLQLLYYGVVKCCCKPLFDCDKFINSQVKGSVEKANNCWQFVVACIRKYKKKQKKKDSQGAFQKKVITTNSRCKKQYQLFNYGLIQDEINKSVLLSTATTKQSENHQQLGLRRWSWLSINWAVGGSVFYCKQQATLCQNRSDLEIISSKSVDVPLKTPRANWKHSLLICKCPSVLKHKTCCSRSSNLLMPAYSYSTNPH